LPISAIFLKFVCTAELKHSQEILAKLKQYIACNKYHPPLHFLRHNNQPAAQQRSNMCEINIINNRLVKQNTRKTYWRNFCLYTPI